MIDDFDHSDPLNRPSASEEAVAESAGVNLEVDRLIASGSAKMSGQFLTVGLLGAKVELTDPLFASNIGELLRQARLEEIERRILALEGNRD